MRRASHVDPLCHCLNHARIKCAEEDRDAWKNSVSHHKLSREYKSFLADAAGAAGKLRCPGSRDRPQLLLANLGPAWGSPAVCALFDSSVLELGGWHAWERPPALGTVPLDILLGICQALFKWLHANDSHMVVRWRICSVDKLTWQCRKSRRLQHKHVHRVVITSEATCA